MLDCPVVPTCATRGSAVIAYAPWLGPRNRGGFSIYMMTSSNGNIFHVTGLCAGNSPVTDESPSHGPVTRSFDVFFDLGLNKRLSKQSRSWWFETPSCALWRHCNDVATTAHMGTARKHKDKETCSNYNHGNMFLTEQQRQIMYQCRNGKFKMRMFIYIFVELTRVILQSSWWNLKGIGGN